MLKEIHFSDARNAEKCSQVYEYTAQKKDTRQSEVSFYKSISLIARE